MLMSPLADAVVYLANKTSAMSDADMGQPFAWKWHENEGSRLALIGSTQELYDLAFDILARRDHSGNPLTTAQRILGLHHTCYRDLQALMLGVTTDLYDREPKRGEWQLRYVYSHIVEAERTFFTLIDYALRRTQGAATLPLELPEGETDRLTGHSHDFDTLMEHGTFEEMSDFARALHERTLATFSTISDVQLETPSLFWEGELLPVRHRLLRFAAHNRQHTVQVEKTLEWLGEPPTEAGRLLRQLYQALAAVENAILGATEEDTGLSAQMELAKTIRQRADEMVKRVEQVRAIVTAIQSRDSESVETLLAAQPQLSMATTQAGVSLPLLALYYGSPSIATQIAAQKPRLSFYEAAALGNVDAVQKRLTQWEEWVHEFSLDGYTALQLACFFGQVEAAKALVKAGSDLNAVSKNGMATTPLHAATAGNHTDLATYLVAQGADLHHTQNGGFTVLHSAVQNGNVELVTLFLKKGVNRDATSDDGRSARDFAEGHSEILALLNTTS